MLNYSPAIAANQTDFAVVHTDNTAGYNLDMLEVSRDGSIVVISKSVPLSGAHPDYPSLVFNIDIFSQANGTLTFLQNIRHVEPGGPSNQRAYGGQLSSIALSTNGDVIALGQNNYLLNVSYSQRGAVFILTRSGNTWALTRTIYNPGSDWHNPQNTVWEGRFGEAVTLSGDGKRLIIGDTRVRYIPQVQYFVGLCFRYDFNTATNQWEQKGNIRPTAASPVNTTYDVGSPQYLSEVGYGINAAQDKFGSTVNLSEDGTQLLITASQKGLTDPGGVVRATAGIGYLFKLINNVYTYEKIFYDTGPGPGANFFGYPVSVSSDFSRVLMSGAYASKIYQHDGTTFVEQARVLTANRSVAPTSISQDGNYAVALYNSNTGCALRLFDVSDGSYEEINLAFTSNQYFVKQPKLVNTLVGMCCFALQRGLGSADNKAVVLFNFG